MKKIQKIIAIIVATLGLISNTPVFAEANQNDNSTSIQVVKESEDQVCKEDVVDTIKVSATTSPAVVVDIPENDSAADDSLIDDSNLGKNIKSETTPQAVGISDLKVVKLDVKFNGLDKDENLLYVGNKATVDVTGYNSEEQKVKLNENLIKYEWRIDGEIVCNDAELEITQDMKDKSITCMVLYDDEGGIK